MTEKRFKLYSEVGFIDTQKCGGDTMTLFEVVVELNKLNEENEELKKENKKLRTLNYVNKEAVRLNNIKTVKIGHEDVDCTNINWELLYELYNGMIDFYYDESGDFE